jgi:hypothetical protein
VGTRRTNELAVMCDAYSPWRLTTEAAALEDNEYHLTWIK